MINSLGHTVFTLRVSVVGKIQPFRRKIVFLSTLQAPSKKTVHIQEFVLEYKVVLNNIIDIIHFDQNTVRSNLKELWENIVSENFYSNQNTLWSNLKYLRQICWIFDFFQSWKFWRLLGGELHILEGESWRSMMFKISFANLMEFFFTSYE